MVYSAGVVPSSTLFERACKPLKITFNPRNESFVLMWLLFNIIQQKGTCIQKIHNPGYAESVEERHRDLTLISSGRESITTGEVVLSILFVARLRGVPDLEYSIMDSKPKDCDVSGEIFDFLRENFGVIILFVEEFVGLRLNGVTGLKVHSLNFSFSHR